MTATTTALPGRLRARLTSFTAGLTALTTTAPQALATRYLYRHLAVTEDGTWAWFLVSDEHWYGKTGHGIDGFVTDQAERFAELEGLRFVVPARTCRRRRWRGLRPWPTTTQRICPVTGNTWNGPRIGCAGRSARLTRRSLSGCGSPPTVFRGNTCPSSSVKVR